MPELRLDGRQADAAGAFAQVREGVLQRLLAAQAALPHGLHLLVIEGYRPPARQRAIFDGYHGELRRLHPQLSEDRLFVEASKFVSPVEVAPHGTGGALDLTLCTADGVEVGMGTRVDDTPEASDNACFTDARNISGQARRNRWILAGALKRAGLVNYPIEWWHWSYGDRYWALLTAAGSACYGPVHVDRTPAGVARTEGSPR